MARHADDVEVDRQSASQDQFDEEQTWLGDLGRSQLIVRATQRGGKVEALGRCDLEEPGAKGVLVQPGGHPGRLAALSRKTESDAGHVSDERRRIRSAAELTR